MSGRRNRKRRTKLTIEQFALNYLTTSKPMARDRVRRRMASSYGWKTSTTAIQQMAETLTLCDPNFRNWAMPNA